MQYAFFYALVLFMQTRNKQRNSNGFA